ncbi:hypothetical protein TBKG_02414 [Mycobacterium tuberculosis '98-R604 INH-RIF-EM']|nr:hypothetical protein TBKG_02414 [Mycobacterium tuberculosis '98-R604 INH-RIF-EM']
MLAVAMVAVLLCVTGAGAYLGSAIPLATRARYGVISVLDRAHPAGVGSDIPADAGGQLGR